MYSTIVECMELANNCRDELIASLDNLLPPILPHRQIFDANGYPHADVQQAVMTSLLNLSLLAGASVQDCPSTKIEAHVYEMQALVRSGRHTAARARQLARRDADQRGSSTSTSATTHTSTHSSSARGRSEGPRDSRHSQTTRLPRRAQMQRAYDVEEDDGTNDRQTSSSMSSIRHSIRREERQARRTTQLEDRGRGTHRATQRDADYDQHYLTHSQMSMHVLSCPDENAKAKVKERVLSCDYTQHICAVCEELKLIDDVNLYAIDNLPLANMREQLDSRPAAIPVSYDVHIPFPGRTCIRLFSSDVLALSL